jgi:alpha-beta hydrolase superfamily lysophospholipase
VAIADSVVGSVTRVFFKDELLDAQLMRVLGSAVYGGADIGECLQCAGEIVESRLGSWHDAWRSLGWRLDALARDEEAAGRSETARLAYLRACSYHRTSGVMLLGSPLDPRLVAAHHAQKAAFRAAARLMAQPVEGVEVPFDGVRLPGYFIRPAVTGEARATVILVGGYDGTCEELYLLNGAAAVQRGYNVLAVDGPGQGSALIEHGLTLRPDWEHVVGAMIDYLQSRSDVDPARIAVIGLSLGAHLAPRAASGERRLAACIADCGSYDLYSAALERMPTPLAQGLRDHKLWARLAAGPILRILAVKPTAGWALRRGMLVHGAPTPLAYIDALRDFTLRGRAEQITCPTWVCNAEGDDIGASAPELVTALTCPHVFVTFTRAEGAGDHCEQGARALYHARSFAWLDDLLHPERPASR